MAFPNEYLKTCEEHRKGGFRQAGITRHVNSFNKRVAEINKKPSWKKEIMKVEHRGTNIPPGLLSIKAST